MGPAPPNSQMAPLPTDLPFRLVSKTIGQGAYASIRKAVPHNSPKPVIAIKFINKEHALRTGRLTPKQIKMEIVLHSHLGKHHNIIHCLGSGEDALWTWIAMELAEGGDLFDKIEADEGVGEDIAHFYFTQLVNAVTYMHSKGVAHRDIKPENVLLSAEGDLKLSDFGLAALFKKDGQLRLCNTVCGSPPYIAPEIVSGRRSKRADMLDSGYAANICDIWSCGIVLFVLLVGNTPWDEPTKRSAEFKEYVETGGHTTDELWSKIPPELTSLLRGMLKVDPKERFTLDEVRTHPWCTRKNPYLTASGRNANPVGLATQMLSQLRIDFSRPPTQSQRGCSQDVNEDGDAMDIDTDSDPRRSSAVHFLSSTQPETPSAETPFDWERPPRIASYDGISASQPVSIPDNRPINTSSTPYLSQLPSSTQDMLSQDPSMTQFSSTPGVPLTFTQAARKFADILPSYSLARFISPHTLGLLMPLLLTALHRLGVPAPSFSEAQIEEAEEAGTASIRVKMADGRRQGLNGHIVIEQAIYEGSAYWEVRFVKASGDPLEWRRFFKNMVLCVGDVVLRPN
ncbi:Serine/threonine-protein kinase [Alternaria arborescens]|uniref:non-specific serine/threonine protein kinase n=1 Tax=Alternaria arborescens TaxID=156630 RepID=A0A4Q4RGB8_9PLEO|nr:Serine/threonine-protein kinase [Alternaria arborescens]RYN22851.1 Serine/threonine-protein kinase [Alternaria arborescens]RYO32365.1 Serine/threonine-protein kinase [Alternaria arborescens]RYO55446.1 Serine/threonine-protein kinase [Alternaria arborescens]